MPAEQHMVVVIQNNNMLRQARDINVVKITSNLDGINAPYNVRLPANTLGDRQRYESKIECHAIYGVTKEVLLNGEYCGQIPDEIMEQIDNAILFSLGFFSED